MVGDLGNRCSVKLMSISLPTEQNSALARTPELERRPVQMLTEGGLMAYLRKVWAIANKDLRAEIRAKEVFSTMAAFSVLAIVIFGMAFDLP